MACVQGGFITKTSAGGGENTKIRSSFFRVFVISCFRGYLFLFGFPIIGIYAALQPRGRDLRCAATGLSGLGDYDETDEYYPGGYSDSILLLLRLSHNPASRSQPSEYTRQCLYALDLECDIVHFSDTFAGA
jgi:hypothetical protein